jgi:hypothetical protein
MCARSRSPGPSGGHLADGGAAQQPFGMAGSFFGALNRSVALFLFQSTASPALV